MEEFESEAVLERLVSYINVFCSRHSHATVKVSEIFRNDAEALKLLSKMMGNKYVRDNVLEEQCKCKFQGGGKWRELVVQPLSGITDCHVDMIRSKLCGCNSNVKRKREEAEVLTIPFRNPIKSFGDLSDRQQQNVKNDLCILMNSCMGITKQEVESVAISLLNPSKKQLLKKNRSCATCCFYLPLFA